MTNVIDLVQGSKEWHAARAGSLGASSLHEVVAKTKSGWSTSRANRMASLILERLTGKPQDSYTNAAMQHGVDTEPEARAAYEFHADADVTLVGLVRHPSIVGTHASPDGLVGQSGVLEIKCPQPAAHLALLEGEPIPSKYLIQVQWQIRCCDREWGDFVSYNPFFPERMRLFAQRVPRDDKHITELEASVRDFLSELEEKLSALVSRYGERKEAA
jgi:putative phage-type endonuclease